MSKPRTTMSSMPNFMSAVISMMQIISFFSFNGGRGEIRTLGRFAPTQPFQGC